MIINLYKKDFFKELCKMSESTGIAIITIGGLIAMGAVAFGFIKIMINTANSAKSKHN